MKYRNLFDCLENAEDSTMEKITENAPELGNEQLERILDMSERKYNTKKRERINTEYTDGYGADAVAEGVEPYNRPAWVKFAATAAALVLTAGVLALSHNLLGRRGGVHETPEIPIVAATASVTTTGTTDAENAELTTVIADNATTVTEAAAVTSAPAQQSQENKADTNTPSSAAKTTNDTVENVLSEAECMNVINSYLDERITCSGMRTVLSDYLDTSDTFTTKFTITFDDVYESDGSHRLPEEYTITFVHYVNPKFRTLAEMRDYV